MNKITLAVSAVAAAGLFLVLTVAPAEVRQAVTQRKAASAQAGAKVVSDQQATEVWAQYRPGTEQGLTLLGAVRAKGALPPTGANVQAAIEALRSPSAKSAERAEIFKLLTDMARASASPEMQRRIANAMYDAYHAEQDREAARMMAIHYAANHWQPNTAALLKHANSGKVLDDNEYYGLLAGALPGASDAERAQLIDLVHASRNPKGIEVLTGSLSNRDLVAHLDLASAAAALRVVRPNEPQFPLQTSRYSIGDLMMYGDWVGSTLALTARVSGDPLNQLMPRILPITETSDPRKLIAVLRNPPYLRLVKESYDRHTVARMDAMLAAYAAKYPGNVDVQNDVGIARNNLKK